MEWESLPGIPHPRAREWSGPLPNNCEICGGGFRDEFLEGRVRALGTWLIMCEECHRHRGVGLGPDSGWRYDARTGMNLTD